MGFFIWNKLKNISLKQYLDSLSREQLFKLLEDILKEGLQYN